MKKILILGNDGYIGSCTEVWLKKYNNLDVKGICIKNDVWKKIDFQGYDSIVDTVGIAHLQPKKELKPLFYSINTDLTITLCEKAREAGVGQFIFLSSMNVFGDNCGIITSIEHPKPSSFYGDSKLKADNRIQAMNSETFKVASVRPPAVYGKGCKGNFPTLVKYATKLPVFPEYKQMKSMIFIDNLCEFIHLLIENESSGLYHPQNREYTSTTQMVKAIAEQANHKIKFIKVFNPMLYLLEQKVQLVNRAFANDAYMLELSADFDYEYCKVGFMQSIKMSLELT